MGKVCPVKTQQNNDVKNLKLSAELRGTPEFFIMCNCYGQEKDNSSFGLCKSLALIILSFALIVLKVVYHRVNRKIWGLLVFFSCPC